MDEPDFSQDMFERMSAQAFTANSRPVVIHQEDTFHCSPDLKGCPIAKKASVYVPLDMFNKWIFLAGQLKTEWMAYLIGHAKEDKEHAYVITDMYFPKQKAGPAHVEAADGEIIENVVAAVHSHVGMNVFFSGTDEDHFNHNIELVVNNKGEILATGRTQLECGRFHRGPAEIIFTACSEEMALEAKLRSQLEREQVVYTFTSPSPNANVPGNKFTNRKPDQHQLPLPS